MTILTTNLDQLPSNIPIVDNRGFPTQAFVFYLLKTIKKAGTDNTNFDNIQLEVDRIELGTGLHPDGSYSPDITAHYISAAVSLFDADILIDISLHNLQTEVNTTQSGAGLNTDGAYLANALANYISTATSLKDADNKLDAQIKSNTDNISTNSGDISTLQSDISTVQGDISIINSTLSTGITIDVTLMDSPTTYKTLHFTNGLLTSVT